MSRRLKAIAMCFGQMYVLGDVPINFDHFVELVTCARKIDADFHLMCDLFCAACIAIVELVICHISHDCVYDWSLNGLRLNCES